jgi:hypothetical protein
MKTSRFAGLVLACAVALPTLASAQAPFPSNTTVHSFYFDGTNGAGQSAAGFRAGPYRINEVTKSQFDVFCIDFDNHALTNWDAKVVTFADVIGNVANYAAAKNVLGVSSISTAQLRTVGYLSSLMTTANSSNWGTLHGEIWSVFSSNTDLNGYRAGAAAAMLIAQGNSTYDGYDMFIDQNAYSEGGCSGESVCTQTFIVSDAPTGGLIVTPEPATYALMGAGLLAVGFVRRRRNNQLA